MSYFSFKGIKIDGIAAAVPSTVVKAESFKEQFGDEVVDKFVSMTGIKETRHSATNQCPSDFAYVAAERLINQKNIVRSQIGVLVFVSLSQDYKRPSTACVLHKRLALSSECAAFDVGLGCSGFVYGLQIASAMLQSSTADLAMLCFGEVSTKLTHSADRSSVMLFGDGGGAVLLRKDKGAAPIDGFLCSDGNGYKAIIVPGGEFRNPNAPHDDFVWSDGNTRSLYNICMNGQDVFQFTISDVPKSIKAYWEQTSRTTDSYDVFALHQANYFILKQLAKKLKVPMDKVPVALDKYGNTSVSSIPLLLCDALGQRDGGKVSVFATGFGVGLSWGGVSFTVDAADIYAVEETDGFFEEGIMKTPSNVEGTDNKKTFCK